MPDAPPAIPYAHAMVDDASLSKWLRRSAGWAAAVYGAGEATSRAYFIALSRKWFVAPIDFGRFTLAQDVVDWAEVAAHVLLLVAGVLVLRSAKAGVAALRAAAAAVLLAIWVQQAHNMVAERFLTFFRPYNLLGAVAGGSVLPALLIVMTLGPMGRAMRRA